MNELFVFNLFINMNWFYDFYEPKKIVKSIYYDE